MNTQTSTFTVYVKFSNQLGTHDGYVEETVYEDILLADSYEGCLKDLLKDVEEIIAKRKQRSIQATPLQVKIYMLHGLTTIGTKGMMIEIAFSWQKDLSPAEHIDSYNIMSIFEDFMKRNNLA